MAGVRARRLNVPLRRVAQSCAVMLFLLLGHVTVIQAFGSHVLNADRRNQRPLIDRFDHPRGDILTHDGTVIATSEATGTGPYLYRRVYPGGPSYAAVTGHLSLNSATGVEAVEDGLLSGEDPKVKVRSLVGDGGAGGADVRLTISERAQEAAYRGLESAGRPGAAVAINPSTGAVLALATYPSYDPNELAVFDRDRVAQAARRLRRDPARPLLNRALNRLYPPGGTFKVVTTAAALASGEYGPTSYVRAPARLRLPGTPAFLQNPGAAPCGNARPTLAYAFQTSCDTAFAAIGLQLGHDILRDQAEAFGFNAHGLTIPLATTASTYPVSLDRPQTALAAIGHQDNLATPLMIAMLSAAVANDGVLMRPYLVEDVRLPDGSLIGRANPAPYRTAVPPMLARYLAAMMTTVTHAGGTGTAAAIPGVEVAAKTAVTDVVAGTEEPALVTAFAPAETPQVAVGVVLERAGPQSPAAVPIARAVLQAAMT